MEERRKGAEGLAVCLVVANDEKELEKVLVRSKRSGPHVNSQFAIGLRLWTHPRISISFPLKIFMYRSEKNYSFSYQNLFYPDIGAS